MWLTPTRVLCLGTSAMAHIHPRREATHARCCCCAVRESVQMLLVLARRGAIEKQLCLL